MSPPGSGEEKHVPPALEKAPRGPRDFLTILFKHRSKVAVIFLAVVLAAILVSFLIPPTYEARSSLMVKTGREYVNRPEPGDTGALMLLQMEEVVNSETRILSSRELVERVLTTLKVETVYPELTTSPSSTMPALQAAVLAFGKNLTVEGVRKSNVIEVAFRAQGPAGGRPGREPTGRLLQGETPPGLRRSPAVPFPNAARRVRSEPQGIGNPDGGLQAEEPGLLPGRAEEPAPEAVPGGEAPRAGHPQGDPARPGEAEGAGNRRDPGRVALPERQGGRHGKAVGDPGERDPVVRPAGHRVPGAEAGRDVQ